MGQVRQREWGVQADGDTAFRGLDEAGGVRRAFGSAEMKRPTRVVASAPGRCGIVGNPTDMYGGTVVSCTVPMRAFVSIEPASELILEADDGAVVIRDVSDLAPASTHTDIFRSEEHTLNSSHEWISRMPSSA